jgi:DNA polymerase II small subunit
MKPELVKFCIEKGLLLDREALDILSEIGENEFREIVNKLILCKEKIITRSSFTKNFELFRTEKDFFEKLCIKLGVNIEISREIHPIQPVDVSLKKKEEPLGRNVKVIYSSSSQTKKIEVEDFVKYFRVRFSEIRKMLQERPELESLVSINKISGQRQNISLVGIVGNKRITKNKNIMIEIEDLTGRVTLLINQNKPEVYAKAKDVVMDSVIGVKGMGNKEIIFVTDLVYPDAILQEKAVLERDESAAFTSDIHVGSKMFLEKNLLRFISWLNGEVGDENQRKEARKVKYLFITGDTIDGVGIYPGQESFLTIKDIGKQYEKLAEYLSRIRKDVTIILCPGQHDAVRVAEPQPVIGKEYGYALYDLENVILVSNPALVEITNSTRKGVRVLMYHGDSLIPLISEVESLRAVKAHDTPSKIVRHLLKMRHLSVMHSQSIYIPNEKEDELVIREIPDVITTADLHRPEVDMYNNILIMCCSCWQSITPFEEKVGNHPDPCKVPILNLKTRQVKIMDFSDVPEEKICEEKQDKIVCEVKK